MASPRPFTVRGLFCQLATLCAAGILSVAPANAQRRGVVMSAPVQARPAVRVAPAPQPAHVVGRPIVVHPVNREHPQVRSNAEVANGFRGNRNNFACVGAYGSGVSLQQLLNPVPPYGFDYQYLNAVDSDLAEKAAIDPATQNALREASRLGCAGVGTGGYILWGGGYAAPQEVEEEPAEAPAQPQVIVVQVPTAAAQPAAQPVPATEDTEAPLPDEPQFVLVMRDGTQLQTEAFTRSANEIIYITPDGARRTIALSDLDKDATIRVNSERGTELQLSL